jgi:hypothetical protein
MTTHDERGMATAEYTTCTLAAVLIGAVLYRLGMLDDANPWIESLRDVLDRALGLSLPELFRWAPRIGGR